MGDFLQMDNSFLKSYYIHFYNPSVCFIPSCILFQFVEWENARIVFFKYHPKKQSSTFDDDDDVELFWLHL